MAARGTPYPGREDEFDLGTGCSFNWYADDDGVFGLIEHHPKQDPDGPGLYCGGYIAWRPAKGLNPGAVKHHLLSGAPGDEESLTVAPSLLCRTCGNHGFIREGRWIPA